MPSRRLKYLCEKCGAWLSTRYAFARHKNRCPPLKVIELCGESNGICTVNQGQKILQDTVSDNGSKVDASLPPISPLSLDVDELLSLEDLWTLDGLLSPPQGSSSALNNDDGCDANLLIKNVWSDLDEVLGDNLVGENFVDPFLGTDSAVFSFNDLMDDNFDWTAAGNLMGSNDRPVGSSTQNYGWEAGERTQRQFVETYGTNDSSAPNVGNDLSESPDKDVRKQPDLRLDLKDLSTRLVRPALTDLKPAREFEDELPLLEDVEPDDDPIEPSRQQDPDDPCDLEAQLRDVLGQGRRLTHSDTWEDFLRNTRIRIPLCPEWMIRVIFREFGTEVVDQTIYDPLNVSALSDEDVFFELSDDGVDDVVVLD